MAASLALHAAAAASILAAVTWRTLPAPPGAEPALEILWLAPPAPADAAAEPQQAPQADAATREVATLGPAAQEGAEPEDALATMVTLPEAPPASTEPVAALPPLPVEMPEPPPLPADPTGLFAAGERSPQMAALPLPPPAPAAAEPAEALPLPPPLPTAPPRRAAAAPRTAPAPAGQPAAHAVPAPAAAHAAAPAAIPVVSSAPRFRRPPVPPDYPLRAKEAGITGTALLRLRVAADGSTREIRLLRSAGHRLLDEAAQAAARRWEIAPALQDGRAIEAWVEVPVRFALEE